MRSIPRWLTVTLVVVVLLALALSSAITVMLRNPYPQVEGEIPVSAVGAPVTVLRDDFGIPQIYADTPEDLFAAQGFVAAQERFFEMDVRRHATSGRLAELFGADQVESDAYVRTMGWHRVAEEEVELLPADTRRLLESYAAGVNEYLFGRATEDISTEYAILGVSGLTYRPEPWTVADSLAWLKAMAWSLDGNLTSEVEYAQLRQVLDAEQWELLDDDPDLAPVLTEGTVVDGEFVGDADQGSSRPADDLPTEAAQPLQDAGKVTEAVQGLLGSSADNAVGSNSWVISGDHTASGMPILSNDPHLGTSIPSVFMQIGLHCRTVDEQCPYDVSGYSFSGMPGVIIGHNQSIGWGLTTPYLDTQDLVIERVRNGRVETADGEAELQVRTERIEVRDAEPRELQVREGPNGPLLSDVDPQLAGVAEIGSGADAAAGEEYAVALSWTGLSPSTSAEAIFALDRAQDFDEFRDAARLLGSPAQNLVYADVEGNIGYQLPGTVPIRNGGDGTVPTLGWTEDAGWSGTIPFEELPYSYNPPSGLIVAANQTIVEDYPGVLQAGQSAGWRAEQLEQALSEADRLDLDTAQELFVDDDFRLAETMVPLLQNVYLGDPWVREGRDLLGDWDGSMDSDSATAAWFALVVRSTIAKSFGANLPEDLAPAGGERWYAALEQLLLDPENPWWDDPETSLVERRDDVLAAAMVQARKEGTVLMSDRMDTWSWGRLHRLELQHQTLGSSGVGLLESLFNRGQEPIGGGSGIVEAWGWDDRNGDFTVTTGPAMRMLVDFSNLDNSRWINQSGTSGHTTNPNYADQYPLMVRNELQPFLFSAPAIDAASTRRLTLVPR
ncbi:penicillin acylase family protein [Naumannella halotolerans]|uniref:penicillin acylase family protein n=1 Tax=Naumannella halotolerans TaxID=993414 RepID=UPI00370DD1E8